MLATIYKIYERMSKEYSSYTFFSLYPASFYNLSNVSWNYFGDKGNNYILPKKFKYIDGSVRCIEFMNKKCFVVSVDGKPGILLPDRHHVLTLIPVIGSFDENKASRENNWN